MMLACSRCELFPALLFVRPYQLQRRWGSNGEIQTLEAPSSDLVSQWPRNVWLKNTQPGRVQSLSKSIQTLCQQKAITVVLDREELFFTMEQSKKDDILMQISTEDRLLICFDLLKLTLFSCPDAFAERFWLSTMAILKPIIDTTIIPFLSVLEWEHLESQSLM